MLLQLKLNTYLLNLWFNVNNIHFLLMVISIPVWIYYIYIGKIEIITHYKINLYVQEIKYYYE